MAKSATAIALVMPSAEFDSQKAAKLSNRADLVAFFHGVGELLANAQISKTEAAYAFRDACRDKVAHVATKGSDDAETCYLAIANSHNATIAGRQDVDAMPADAKTAKSAISVFRTFGRPAVIAQGDDWFARVSRMRDLLGAECKLSAYMAMHRANVRVSAASDKMIGNRFYVASDADICDYIRNAPATPDTADEALAKVLKAMVDASKEHESRYTVDVLDAMALLLDVGGKWIHDYTVVTR